MIHTAKGFGIINKAEINVFLELSCFFHDPADVGNLISGSSAFSKTSLNIRKFTGHVLLKPGLENSVVAKSQILSLCFKNNFLCYEICILGTHLKSVLPYMLEARHPDQTKGVVASTFFYDLGARMSFVATSVILRDLM